MAFAKLIGRRLSNTETEQLVKRELERILESCTPKLVLLFGSAARVDMAEGSDLDFIVVLADTDDLRGAKRRFYSSRQMVDQPVDILFFRESEFNARKDVGGVCFVAVREGKILYRSETGSPVSGEVENI